MTLWTDQRKDRLAELWGRGIPASEIGRMMRIGRNAVIGKAHRMGLAHHALLNPHRPVIDSAPTPSPRDRECQWPTGDPKEPDFHFCFEPIQQGSSYCPEHTRRAWAREDVA